MKRLLLALALSVVPVVSFAQTAVVVRGRVATANATSSLLANAAVFTGGWEDTRDYSTLTVTVFADQDSATDGLEVQWSGNASNIDLTELHTIVANTGASWTTVARARYFRLKYTNGSVTQTAFRLSAVLRQAGGPETSASGGGVSNTELRASPLDVLGPLTNTELRATPVPVSGTVTATPTGTQVVSGTVTANAGTGTLAVSGPVTDTQLRATPVPVSGTVTVTDGAGALNVIVDSGTTTVTQATAANLNATVTDGSGAMTVDGTVTANAGTNLNTSALALDATVGRAQGSTTSGQTGPLAQGAVTTAAPTYTTAQTSPLSLTTTGALRTAETATVTVTDGSGSMTVDGTVTTTPPSNASTNLTQIVGTAADVNSGTKSAGTLRVVIATDQPALTNKLLVTPDSVALPANQSVNVSQVAGTTADTNSGTKSAGTLRVVLATDQPALTNKLLVTPDSVALPANQSVNLSQVGGTTTVNGGLAGSVAIGGTAGNNAAITQNPLVLALEARSSAPTAATNGNQIRSAGDLAGNQFNVYPLSWSCALDNIAATLTQCQAAAAAGVSYYVTNVVAQSTTATAATFAIRSGTGSNCGTGTAGVLPGASTSRTYVLPANTAAPFQFTSTTGVKLTAAHAVCAIGAATNTLNITIMGYTAP